MKNWKRYLAVALLFCFAVTIVPIKAHADALTAGMIASTSYAMMSSWGINFTAGSATGQGMSNYMEGQVEKYVNSHGGSLSSLFGAEAVRLAAGKLVVGHQLYNGVKNFVDWMKETYTITSQDIALTDGEMNGVFLPTEQTGSGQVDSSSWVSVVFETPTVITNQYQYSGYRNATIYVYGQQLDIRHSAATAYAYTGVYMLHKEGNTVYCGLETAYRTDGSHYSYSNYSIGSAGDMTNTLSWREGDYYREPQPLPQNKEGEYSFPGWADPPTDLPDFLTRIPVGVANNDLVVAEEITEAGGGETPPSPSPSPEPGPSYDKGVIALLVAEILSIINSLSGDTAVPEETIEGLADQIADTAQTVPDAITQTGTQTQTAIQDATQTITDTMTDTQTQTQTAIQDATQTITDIMTDTQTQTQTAIQDATQTITDTITDISDVPDDFEPQKHPLPRGVFPFCIPFDLHDFIVALSADPVTPEIHVPFDLNLPLPGGNVLPFHYQFDLDLHDFDGLAQVLRTLEFIAFGVGLLFVTGKVIKW